MENWLVVLSSLLFFLHLAFESLGSFVKYNFASLGWQMTGVSWAGILAIVSRGFVALFGVFVAAIVESGLVEVQVYSFVFSIVLLLAGWFSIFLAGKKISDQSVRMIESRSVLLVLNPMSVLMHNSERLPKRINAVVAILMGTQFVAVIVAYGLCFFLPEHRLLVISMVPVVSMLGTVVTFVIVEPGFARLIDGDCRKGCAVSGEFLRARAMSFLFCATLLFVMGCFLAV